MSRITLALDIPCTPKEAKRFVAVLVFLDAIARDPAALPGPELDGLFGTSPRETLLGLVGHPVPLGLSGQYDGKTGVLSVTDDLGAPNLAALPVLFLWLYPEKLPLAYAVRTAEDPVIAVWTIVSLNRIEIIQDEAAVGPRLAALRAEARTSRRIGFAPPRGLPGSSH